MAYKIWRVGVRGQESTGARPWTVLFTMLSSVALVRVSTHV